MYVYSAEWNNKLKKKKKRKKEFKVVKNTETVSILILFYVRKGKILNLAAATACPTSWTNTDSIVDIHMLPIADNEMFIPEYCRKSMWQSKSTSRAEKIVCRKVQVDILNTIYCKSTQCNLPCPPKRRGWGKNSMQIWYTANS